MELVHIPRETPLLEGVLVRRYKRFLADVELADGRLVTAHCVNTGAMEGLTTPGFKVWLSRATNPDRKLKFTWELTEVPEGEASSSGIYGPGIYGPGIYGTNTSYPNRLVRRLLEERRLPWLSSYEEITPEKRYGERSRVDFYLASSKASSSKSGRREMYLEVKNCHLVYPDRRAYFPDSVSQRATHHLEELATVAASRSRTRAHVLFTCQMPGVKELRPSDAHDPTFATKAREVAKRGITYSAIEVLHTPEEIVVTRRIPVSLKPYRFERMARWGAESRKKRET